MEYMENIPKNICARAKIEFLCYIVRCDTKSVEALEFLALPLTYSYSLSLSLPLFLIIPILVALLNDIAQYAQHF